MQRRSDASLLELITCLSVWHGQLTDIGLVSLAYVEGWNVQGL